MLKEQLSPQASEPIQQYCQPTPNWRSDILVVSTYTTDYFVILSC